MWKAPGYPYFELIFFFFLRLQVLVFWLLEFIFTKTTTPTSPPQISDLWADIWAYNLSFLPLCLPSCISCLLISSPVFLSCLKPRVVLLPLNPCVALITKVCDLCRFCIICSVHSLCWVSLSFRPSVCFVLIILAAWYLFLYWSSLNCITTVFQNLQ